MLYPNSSIFDSAIKKFSSMCCKSFVWNFNKGYWLSEEIDESIADLMEIGLGVRSVVFFYIKILIYNITH